MSRIIDFYLYGGPDQHGRTLDFIIAKDDAWWEGCHDHIQWVLPTNKPSEYNPDAPLLTKYDINTFLSIPAIRTNARRSFYRFLKFLGLDYNFNYNIVYAGRNFDSLLKPVWLMPNHNHLRVTRCLEFMVLIRLEKELEGFYNFLTGMKNVFYKELYTGPFYHWQQAYNKLFIHR